MKKSLKINELGRSMVEILGVLAIIGVLSIGSIQGYRYAMEKYNANQIANEVSIILQDLDIQMMNNAESLTLSEPYAGTDEILGQLNTMNIPIDFNCGNVTVPLDGQCRQTNAFYLELQGVNQGICQQLVPMFNGNLTNLNNFTINNQISSPENCIENDNIIVLNFNSDKSVENEIRLCQEDTEDCICENGICVECRENSQCEDTEKPACINNTCGVCPNGSYWNGNDCIEGCQNASHCPTNSFCNSNNKCISCNDAPSSITYSTKEAAQNCADACDNSYRIRVRAQKICYTCESTSWKDTGADRGLACANKCTNAGIAHDEYAEWCINCNGYVNWNNVANAAQSCGRCARKGVPCFNIDTKYYPCSISTTNFSTVAGANTCANRCANRFAYKQYCYECSKNTTYTYETEADAQKCASSCTGTAKRIAVGLECKPA